MDRKTTTGLLVLVLPLSLIGLVFGMLLFGSTSSAACGPSTSASVTIDLATVPDGPIAGFSGDQLINAAYIITAGHDLALSERDQTIGVMTAIGESSLLVLDYGDAAGPDSRGLFQQRDNGAWGSYADRMDPYISATNFFRVLATVENRDSLSPTQVAHRVQRNANPNHYAPYWDAAVQIVTALGTLEGTGARPVSAVSCDPLIPGTLSASGWSRPADGPITSPYGMRVDPVTGSFTLMHIGTDLNAGGCGGPIWAIQDGHVSRIWADSYGGWTVQVDHNGGVLSEYKHSYRSDILVRIGEPVTAGQQIARTGDSGWSTGCHLHFAVLIDGVNVSPELFMQSVGVEL